ncbi:hypothetical protein Vadar_017213 [Vaccinium darrowii]|uniref:Uncharacterized protein n=1 Tax=Vaccinium darrowii TaxID=229202 RepID=A0ACB7YMZ6_9ERIC|nr:hypothetical protein Vadar_017213 [Vaccinium darrowii]
MQALVLVVRFLPYRRSNSLEGQSGAVGTMINDQDLGFISNFLGIFIPLLVTAYHYVIADLKCEGSSKDQAGCNVFLDAKHALDLAFAVTTGVKTENLLMSPPDWCAH